MKKDSKLINTVYDRVLQRELGNERRYSKVRGIYGDRKWIDNLDIVNELAGHSGCVNALSWSRSGRLLASGSDDQHVNIHSYLPESSSSQFSLATTILTGHVQNIFSVKFMPYSNDHTIVTVAGDAEVRVFDIEYSGRSISGSSSTTNARPSELGLHNFSDGVRVLSDGDTNSKVFRSHSDRVKRIVTESSPFFFLTCSEDGEVRQWDTRQPSSFYPPPREVPRWASASSASDNVPPPLISYKRYHLDLNTISCSPSQPHYIALGGAHLHCFLHDRRMLGRDKLAERGAMLGSPSQWDDRDDELMGQATQCVRKFAPNGQRRMKRTDNGHITACKISDANPNEMIVSWSGEWIYSFDLLRSPDAKDQGEEPRYRLAKEKSLRARESKARKRKRQKSGSMVSHEGLQRGSSRQRTESTQDSEHDEMALMVHFGNGQSEEIPIEPTRPRSPHLEVREPALPESERQSHRIGRDTVKIRTNIFTLKEAKKTSETDPTGHASSFTSVIGLAASILPEMDEIMRTWRYPVNPHAMDVEFQNGLRDNRAVVRRFVQASGTLARVLGGRLRTAGSGGALISKYFTSIHPAPNERPTISKHEQFGYDFLKAILLWLDSGVGALLEGFSISSRTNPRFPIEENASVDVVDDVLIPYLLQLASDDPVVNVDASRLEVNENRWTFASEKAAVLSFAQALKIPFADLSSAVVLASPAEGGAASASHIHAQDRRTALKFWAFKVGRGVLMNAGKGINYRFAARAFGGQGRPDANIRAEESALRARQEDVDPDEEEDVVVNAEIVGRLWAEESGEGGSSQQQQPAEGNESANPSNAAEQTTAASDDSDSDGDLDIDEDDDGDDDDETDEDEEQSGRFIWRSAFERRKLRERVEMDVPCSPHMNVYRGHCNVKTVKDVNFFGLQDEYVVSGSDSGHIFIWDRKSSLLLNILEGDGEVVNVVQGHPYEPMLAVSGIDHTIKIFSPDARARYNARNGIGIRPADPTTFSSLGFGRSRRRHVPSVPTSEPAVPRNTGEESDDEDAESKIAVNGLTSKKCMHLEYQITSQNDVDRRGGNREAFITRSMLAQLAQRIHDRVGEEDGDGEGTGPVLISDDCTVM